ncbi:Glycosyltransferase, catalytic subunit of cellulose synthase and poly-beta-1,6-N-acetylglucosamine synthase [Hymenobacter daecheongensis DSM 21074]|uniref:Glycosyltransferase, catalytic subunit of cellulose synthase and poly-beta-1,6-N-acetylglucosamine synthase n=1 Tax=Hymenobacter daecheongensis DSM 21074 TaxID=1121955 RepID=A0A1M6I5G5_9BACT|nr:glycosyltransferase [Hymenobacter daecheongensis]SHJ29673.1 Glycosyltransferase, catalytic subunit of cellulose synthase and poly-beta-1,6-N-acetylglucosamine synthase [Hymenobacter daecheongensis DSM 21074]
MLTLLTIYFGLWFLVLGAATVLFWRHPRPAAAPLAAPLPRVSILIAARNEEAAISRCLLAIRALHYPAHLIEVLLGDDASTDRTTAVAEAAMRGYAGHFRCLRITDTLGSARGKANVLAHLTRVATTDFFLLTDADIAVPPTWVAALLAPALPPASRVGTVTGLTVVRGPRLFDQLQGLDWLLSLGLVQVVSDRGRPVTAMGNNMLVTRAAYEATGGYEALPFSVTEDFALFKAVLARGFTFRHVFRPEVLAFSLPIGTPAGLLHQRRRWLGGVEALPGWLQGGLLFYGAFYLMLALLAVVGGPLTALTVLAAKMLLQGLLAHFCFHRAGLRLRWALLPAFELYTIVLTLGLGLFRVFGLKFDWKGRQYR